MALSSSATKASQDFVPIKEIRDGLIVLKDGSMRAIVMASSLNFALKSQDEQSSIIFQFQNFLNSLNFSVQINIQSRRLDIKPYLALLAAREKEQISDLMKLQVRQYIEFIDTLTQNTNIMTKSFFVTVPYSPTVISSNKGGLSGITNIFGSKTKQEKKDDVTATFEENRTQLEQRVAVVEEGLTRCGIRVVELGTEELIELFYKSFNPGEIDKPAHQ
jgi:hypothetical protein